MPEHTSPDLPDPLKGSPSMALPTAALRTTLDHLNTGLRLLSTRHTAHPPADLAEAADHLRYLVRTTGRLAREHIDQATEALNSRSHGGVTYQREQLRPVQRVRETAMTLAAETSAAFHALTSAASSYSELDWARRRGHLEQFAPFPPGLRLHLERTERPAPITRQALGALGEAEEAAYVVTGDYGRTRAPAAVAQSTHLLAEVYKTAEQIAELLWLCAWNTTWAGRADVPLAARLEPVRRYGHQAKTALGVLAVATTEHTAALQQLARALPELQVNFWG
ncbi:hypothetical protein [Crossiella sp. CA198]|uniref:hypothetical protein n=1 Tax=Crossiella sp. CA198 TaxID=3455607 RepID=UPI003F8D517B